MEFEIVYAYQLGLRNAYDKKEEKKSNARRNKSAKSVKHLNICRKRKL